MDKQALGERDICTKFITQAMERLDGTPGPRCAKIPSGRTQGHQRGRSMSTHLPADYPALLADIKQRVRHAQTRAMLAVNAELIRLYWDIGALIDQRQKREGWGAAVIPRLARDLHNELPEEKVFPSATSSACWLFIASIPLWLPQPGAQRKCHRPWHNLPPAKSATGCGTKPPGAGGGGRWRTGVFS